MGDAPHRFGVCSALGPSPAFVAFAVPLRSPTVTATASFQPRRMEVDGVFPVGRPERRGALLERLRNAPEAGAAKFRPFPTTESPRPPPAPSSATDSWASLAIPAVSLSSQQSADPPPPPTDAPSSWHDPFKHPAAAPRFFFGPASPMQADDGPSAFASSSPAAGASPPFGPTNQTPDPVPDTGPRLSKARPRDTFWTDPPTALPSKKSCTEPPEDPLTSPLPPREFRRASLRRSWPPPSLATGHPETSVPPEAPGPPLPPEAPFWFRHGNLRFGGSSHIPSSSSSTLNCDPLTTEPSGSKEESSDTAPRFTVGAAPPPPPPWMRRTSRAPSRVPETRRPPTVTQSEPQDPVPKRARASGEGLWKSTVDFVSCLFGFAMPSRDPNHTSSQSLPDPFATSGVVPSGRPPPPPPPPPSPSAPPLPDVAVPPSPMARRFAVPDDAEDAADPMVEESVGMTQESVTPTTPNPASLAAAPLTDAVSILGPEGAETQEEYYTPIGTPPQVQGPEGFRGPLAPTGESAFSDPAARTMTPEPAPQPLPEAPPAGPTDETTAPAASPAEAEGNAHLTAGRCAEAAECFTRVLATTQPCPILLTQRARARFRLGRYEAALEDCQQALHLKEHHSAARITAASAFVMLGRLSHGLAVLQEGLNPAADPGGASVLAAARDGLLRFEATLQRAEDLLTADRRPAVEAELEGLRRDYPEWSNAPPTRRLRCLVFKAKGKALWEERQWDAAHEAYTEALDLAEAGDPTLRAVLHANRAAAASESGQLKAALVDCFVAIALDPAYPKARLRRARVYRQLLLPDHALEDLLEARTLGAPVEPALSEVRRELADLTTLGGQHYQALQVEEGAPLLAVRQAYRRGALQWHPDKCHPPPELHGEAAAEYTAVTEQVFKAVSAAHDVLGDRTKRAQYDQRLFHHRRGRAGLRDEFGMPYPRRRPWSTGGATFF